MRIQADCEAVNADKARVERSLRELRGQLELLQRTRKDATDRNQSQHHATAALTQEYSANLKVSHLDKMHWNFCVLAIQVNTLDLILNVY